MYRKILYKIPLKFLLILLAVVAVFMACFSNAWFTITTWTINVSAWGANYSVPWNYDFFCVVNSNCSNSVIFFPDAFNTDNLWWYRIYNTNNPITQGMWVCSDKDNISIVNESSVCVVTVYKYTYDNYTSLECQTEYSLIPVSSVDQSYCTSNNYHKYIYKQ